MFKKIIEIIKTKEHLNSEGFNQILKIKSNMNKKRANFNWDHLVYLNKI